FRAGGVASKAETQGDFGVFWRAGADAGRAGGERRRALLGAGVDTARPHGAADRAAIRQAVCEAQQERCGGCRGNLRSIEPADDYARLKARLEAVDAKLMAWHRSNEPSRRLARIPGVGPVIASLLAMKTPNPHTFRSGRQYAAWIGLTPKDHSTAGKTRHG